MHSDKRNQTNSNPSELYLDVFRKMYFGSLIYWGNAVLQSQKIAWGGLSSLESDIKRSSDCGE